MINLSKVIHIALIGAGTVGSGVLEVLEKNGEDISKKIGISLNVKKVLEKHKNSVKVLGSYVKEINDI